MDYSHARLKKLKSAESAALRHAVEEPIKFETNLKRIVIKHYETANHVLERIDFIDRSETPLFSLGYVERVTGNDSGAKPQD
jgi:hypothetical protein